MSTLETVILLLSFLLFKEKPDEIEQDADHEERETLINQHDIQSNASSTSSKQYKHLCVQLAYMINNRNYMMFLFSISFLLS